MEATSKLLLKIALFFIQIALKVHTQYKFQDFISYRSVISLHIALKVSLSRKRLFQIAYFISDRIRNLLLQVKTKTE